MEWNIRYIPAYIEYYSKKSISFIKGLPNKSIDKFWEIYNYLTEAFTDWDSQAKSFWIEIKDMLTQAAQFISIALRKIRELISDLTDLIHTLLSSLRGFK